HPNLAELYRRKVADLAVGLKDPAIRTPALETIRSLIDSVTVIITENRTELDLQGAIVAMMAPSPGQPANLMLVRQKWLRGPDIRNSALCTGRMRCQRLFRPLRSEDSLTAQDVHHAGHRAAGDVHGVLPAIRRPSRATSAMMRKGLPVCPQYTGGEITQTATAGVSWLLRQL
ncbi:MAG: hypothetical protein PF443_07895, partial [Allgaiera sp.]|nr:hypothetical protein [Allgaiera sp.]